MTNHRASPSPQGIPEDYCGVDTWYRQLLDNAISPDHAHIAQRRVEQIGRKKEKNRTAEHEYFWVKISETHYLRIERSGEEYVPPTRFRRSTLKAAPSIEPLKDRPADDRVTTKNKLPGDKDLERVSVAHVTLLDLAIAARIVRDSDNKYKLLKKQCYWYSDMIMRVLEGVHGFRVDREDSAHDDDAWVELQEKIAGGTWKDVYHIHKTRDEHTQALVAKFVQEKNTIQDELQQAKNQKEAERERLYEEGIEMGRAQKRASLEEDKAKLEKAKAEFEEFKANWEAENKKNRTNGGHRRQY